jgi:hypothetical protein
LLGNTQAYGKEWVEQALDRPGIEQWGGVIHTLNEYKAEGGPPRKPVKATPAPMVNQWQMPGETPEETAERHQRTAGMWLSPTAEAAIPVVVPERYSDWRTMLPALRQTEATS